jgi:hydroxymethylglutaryl-CoA reductase
MHPLHVRDASFSHHVRKPAGGAIGSHPLARLALKTMHVESSDELGMVMAAVGLAQNFAAMRALVTEGLCRGHMRLHAKNIAISAGAPPHLIARVAATISDDKTVTLDHARHVLAALLADLPPTGT